MSCVLRSFETSQVVDKDTNILLVVIAVKIVGKLAAGLRKKFQPYAVLMLESLFARFKEKKANVIQALKESTDIVAETVSYSVNSPSLLS